MIENNATDYQTIGTCILFDPYQLILFSKIWIICNLTSPPSPYSSS
jgi:hypothetical protein